jgi:hypothetical protein
MYPAGQPPPPGPSTSGGSVGAAGAAASSVAVPSSMGLVPAQQPHPPQASELPSKESSSMLPLCTCK